MTGLLLWVLLSLGLSEGFWLSVINVTNVASSSEGGKVWLYAISYSPPLFGMSFTRRLLLSNIGIEGLIGLGILFIGFEGLFVIGFEIGLSVFEVIWTISILLSNVLAS